MIDTSFHVHIFVNFNIFLEFIFVKITIGLQSIAVKELKLYYKKI